MSWNLHQHLGLYIRIFFCLFDLSILSIDRYLQISVTLYTKVSAGRGSLYG